jgi:hypothetical protein
MTVYYESKEACRLACLAQLYDEWGGWYMLRCLRQGRWVDVSMLSRLEAVWHRPGKDEALELRGI